MTMLRSIRSRTTGAAPKIVAACASSSCVWNSARKPSRPMLIPTTGTPRSMNCRSAAMMVPSPPTTTARSGCSAAGIASLTSNSPTTFAWRDTMARTADSTSPVPARARALMLQQLVLQQQQRKQQGSFRRVSHSDLHSADVSMFSICRIRGVFEILCVCVCMYVYVRVCVCVCVHACA
jgi:hypothetical protein